MKHFAQLRGEDADLWEAVGLLHDMDYERHPNLERSATEGHPFVGVAWLAKRLERGSVPRDSFARRLLRRFAGNAARENSLLQWTS
jgi:Predicted hydrolase (HD superfamily)